MKVFLLENQIELLMKALENFSEENRDKQQLIYSTYESLQAQLVSSKYIEINTCKENERKLKYF